MYDTIISYDFGYNDGKKVVLIVFYVSNDTIGDMLAGVMNFGFLDADDFLPQKNKGRCARVTLMIVAF